jgi:hypothetical protein
LIASRLRTLVEAHPINLSHGRNRRKTLQIARTKIRPKIPPKIKKMKNISAHRKRWFNPNPWMHWCKSRVYKVWKLSQHALTLWRIGGISHFLSFPLFHHEAHPHLSTSNYGQGWKRDGWIFASPPTLGVLYIGKLKTKMPLWTKRKNTSNEG